MRFWAAAVGVCIAALVGGCVEGTFRCERSSQCLADRQGTCEPTGACSFPDESCASGARYGELADATLRRQCTSPPAASSTCAIQVDTGAIHACFLKLDHTVWCWGSSFAGQLGNGTTTAEFTPTAVVLEDGQLLSDVTQISTGVIYTCARRSDGTVWCWGDNLAGQLGDGPIDGVVPYARPVLLDGAPLDQVERVSAGYTTTCAVRTDHSVWCWGANESGQLGDGAPTALHSAVPRPVLVSASVPLLSAGAVNVGAGSWACASRDGGGVGCWGTNKAQQLGVSTGPESSFPLALPTLPTAAGGVHALGAGGAHSCALLSDRSLECWGAGEQGQRGVGATTLEPSPIALDVEPTSLGVGEAHTCVTTRTGRASCWGRGTDGQLGDGGAADHAEPSTVVTMDGAPLEGLVEISASKEKIGAPGRFTCARDEKGVVWCWGANLKGQLGEGATSTFRAFAAPVYLMHACPPG